MLTATMEKGCPAMDGRYGYPRAAAADCMGRVTSANDDTDCYRSCHVSVCLSVCVPGVLADT